MLLSIWLNLGQHRFERPIPELEDMKETLNGKLTVTSPHFIGIIQFRMK